MIDLADTTIVETDRLRLEPFALAHAAALNAIDNEPSVMEFLANGKPDTLDDTKAKIKRVRDAWHRLGYGWWAIIEKDSDTVIGAACVQNVAHKEGAPLEIGWRLASAGRGRGIATEAGQAAIDFAFHQLGVDHVLAVADPRNTASHRVMERLGMQYRGVEDHYDLSLTTYVLRNPALPRNQ